MLRPALDVVSHLVAALPQLTFGQNIYTGPVRPIDDQYVEGATVWVRATGGGPDDPVGAPSLGNRTMSRPRVVITIRSGRGGRPFLDGQELSDAIWGAIDRKPPTGYCNARAQGSFPRHQGPRGDDLREEWVFDVEMWVDKRELSVYYGVGAAGFSLESEVLALANTERSLVRFLSFAVTPAIGEKVYYWFPDTFNNYSDPTFTTDGSAEVWTVTAVTVEDVPGQLYERPSVGAGASVTVIVT